MRCSTAAALPLLLAVTTASASSATNASSIPGVYSTDTVDFIRALPECELHVHIEGTLSSELLFELAERNNVTLDAGNFSSPDAVRERYRNFSGLEDFVQVSEAQMGVFVTEQDYSDLAYDYLKRSHYDGLAYAEVNFLPEGHFPRGISPETVIGGLKKGLERGSKEFNIATNLFSCFSKSHNHTAIKETIDALAPYARSGDLVGLGAAGVEDGFPPVEFEEVYEYAKSSGFQHFTIHAGETGPPDYVRQAAFDLNLTRIDHGISAAQDPALLAELATKSQAEGLHLTVCPLSNVALKVYPEVKDSPLKTFLDAGIKLSLSTDDPTFFGGFILQVYLETQKAFHLDKTTWRRIVQDSIDAAWASESVKEELTGRLGAVMAEWERKEI
ncbi:hypothetical protein JCM8097_006336 [Rhodosporidiobolus ruineniae]